MHMPAVHRPEPSFTLPQYVFTAASPGGAPSTSNVTNPLAGRFTGLRPATQ